jgi:hypothetical protein
MQLAKDFEVIFSMKAKQYSIENKMERAIFEEGITVVGLLELDIRIVINSFFVKIKSVNYFIFNYNIFTIR